MFSNQEYLPGRLSTDCHFQCCCQATVSSYYRLVLECGFTVLWPRLHLCNNVPTNHHLLYVLLSVRIITGVSDVVFRVNSIHGQGHTPFLYFDCIPNILKSGSSYIRHANLFRSEILTQKLYRRLLSMQAISASEKCHLRFQSFRIPLLQRDYSRSYSSVT